MARLVRSKRSRGSCWPGGSVAQPVSSPDSARAMKAIRRCIGRSLSARGWRAPGSVVALLAQVTPDFLPTGLEALALHRCEIGRGQRKVQLLRGQHQVAAGDVVFGHVVVGV